MIRFITLCGLLLLTLTRFAAGQTEFRLPHADWKVTLPKGWEAATSEEVAAFNSEARQAAKSASVDDVAVSYIAGFRPKVDDGSYIVVQVRPSLPPGARFDSISSIFAKAQKSSKVQSASQALGMDPNMQVYGDAPNARIITHSSSVSSGPDALRCISITNLGSSNLVIFHAYGPKHEFEKKHEPVLTSILDSFAFDPGKVYAFGTRDVDERNGVGRTTYTLTKAFSQLSVFIFIGILVAQGIRKWLAR